jgi:hypothetical protein
MITDIEEETLDLDWFGMDDNGDIGHFASGGRGFLPPSVKASRTNLDRITAYFRQEALANGIARESANLALHEEFKSEPQKTRYLADFERMAAKGLYSFDCVVGQSRPSNYFLVATPSCALKVNELPNDIRKIIKMTCFAGEFRSSDVVQPKEFA